MNKLTNQLWYNILKSTDKPEDRNMRKFLCMLVICLLVLAAGSFSCQVYAQDIQNIDKAKVLKELGLFKGSERGFELERAPYRVEGGVMVVRLLGREEFSERNQYQHPFKDVPSWADPYIGYMYHTGLTKGTSAETYSPHISMPAVEYATFVLRALGYDDKENDFHYRSSLEKALEIGLIDSEEYKSLKKKPVFLRDDVVRISFNALSTRLKGSSKTLIEKLVEDDGVITREAAEASGLYKNNSSQDSQKLNISDYGYIAENSGDLTEILKRAIINLDDSTKVDLREYKGDVYSDFERALSNAEEEATDAIGICNIVKYWSYEGTYDYLKVEFKFFYTKDQLDAVNEKAQKIIKNIIKPGMSDYEKELAIHDFIVNNIEYDYDNYVLGEIPQESYTVYGALVLGKAVCQGYAEAMKMLCSMTGLECMVVTGDALAFEEWIGHAWNIIKIDGKYYHVDVTFDDPVMQNSEQTLSYNYFNLTDAEISKNHRWEKENYPVCNSIEFNYYYKNGLLINSKEEFINTIKHKTEEGEQKIVLKIKDYKSENYSDLSEIVFDTGKIKSFSYSINKDLGVITIWNIQYF